MLETLSLKSLIRPLIFYPKTKNVLPKFKSPAIKL
ncbi:hypothetical protein BHO_0900091 (plasmid) [Borrelia hermsii YBT]|uniref:Uncharacterized protein n=1 Tax=Borrelia hermsii YBT TaxID=1313295 RepID=W5T2V5_BORHE|nr:hypothetical protein BHO_0900091 [Borrelia hermsii YBT]